MVKSLSCRYRPFVLCTCGLSTEFFFIIIRRVYHRDASSSTCVISSLFPLLVPCLSLTCRWFFVIALDTSPQWMRLAAIVSRLLGYVLLILKSPLQNVFSSSVTELLALPVLCVILLIDGSITEKQDNHWWYFFCAGTVSCQSDKIPSGLVVRVSVEKVAMSYLTTSQ